LGLFLWLFPKQFGDEKAVRELVVAVLAGIASLLFAKLAIRRLVMEAGMRPAWDASRPVDAFGADWEESRDGLADPAARGTPLTTFQLTGVDLRDAPLVGADLDATDMTDAVLRGADLSAASLRGSILRGANLRQSDIRMASLKKSSLAGASLRDARLDGTDLTGTDLSDADLTGATLAGAVYDGSTCWPQRLPPRSELGAVNIDELR
jgi:uncharacterized protein YjbI with pentapeptide repeats